MIKLFLILTLLASTASASLLEDTWAMWSSQGSAISEMLFSIKEYSPTFVAPSITASTLTDANVTWTRVADSATTNAKVPSITFFSNTNSVYTVQCTDWSKATSYSFAQVTTPKNFLKSITIPPAVSDLMTALTTISFGFNGLSNLTFSITPLPTNINSIAQTWNGCTGLTNAPAVSNLVKVSSLYRTWQSCSGLKSAPEVNTLTNVNILIQTWLGCTGLTNAPDVKGLVNVASLQSTWQDCSGLKSAPEVNTLTNVNTLQSTWYNCYGLTNAPAVSNLVKVSSLYRTWQSCSGLKSAPEVNTLTNVNILIQTWYNCSGLTNAPAVSNLVKISSLHSAWSGCSGLPNTVDSIFGNYTCLSNLTTSSQAFLNCRMLSGVASNFINATKAAGYVVSTNLTSGSYRTFYGCTNLLDYSTIPLSYGGTNTLIP